MLDPIFFFARENRSIAEVSDETIESFAKYAAGGWELNPEDILRDHDFVRARLHYTLTLGRTGMRSARQQMLSADPQVRAAINSIPKAAAFVRSPANRNLSVK
jgi:hypothetical protein